jgi:hypothetical protein
MSSWPYLASVYRPARLAHIRACAWHIVALSSRIEPQARYKHDITYNSFCKRKKLDTWPVTLQGRTEKNKLKAQYNMGWLATYIAQLEKVADVEHWDLYRHDVVQIAHRYDDISHTYVRVTVRVCACVCVCLCACCVCMYAARVHAS